MTRETQIYRKIGLTGGIGSGKTTAARRFAELGALVYHADEISRRSIEPGAACYRRVVDAFGEGILKTDGAIDRKQLAQIVFSDETKRETLNAIIHPYVIEQLFSLAERDLANQPGAIAVFEVPLLFESGLHERMDANILVACDAESRIRRVAERDGISREQVLSRMRAQMPEEEKRLRADYILDNNDSKEALLRQVDLLYETLKAEEPRT